MENIQKLIEIENAALSAGAMALKADAMPGETFLYVALCKKETSGLQWVVWTYNDQDRGFFQGYYTDNKKDAIAEYNKRLGIYDMDDYYRITGGKLV